MFRFFSKNIKDVVELNNKNGCCSIILTEIQIIKYIMEHQNKNIYQRDLEDVLNFRRATISVVLQTMEKNGLVDRVGYLEDVRVKKIILKNKVIELFACNKLKIQELEKNYIKKVLIKADYNFFLKFLI